MSAFLGEYVQLIVTVSPDSIESDEPILTKEFDDIVTSTPFVAFGAAAAGMAILNIMSTDATSANAFFIYSLHGSVSKSSSSDASSSSKSSIL